MDPLLLQGLPVMLGLYFPLFVYACCLHGGRWPQQLRSASQSLPLPYYPLIIQYM